MTQSETGPSESITIEKRFDAGSVVERYGLGAERGVVTGNGSSITESAKWEGNILVIERGTYAGPKWQDFPYFEHEERWLVDNAGLLIVTVVEKTHAGDPRTVILEYRRESPAA